MKRLILCLFVVAACAGCKRRPLVDLENVHYLRVYLDEELLNVTTGFYDASLEHPDYDTPEILRAVLCDPATDRVTAETYLRNSGSDARGNYLDGYITAYPGDYNLLVYNYDTETTQIRDAQTYRAAEAYTGEIDSYLRSQLYSRSGATDERIVYDPDHLFAARRTSLNIPYRTHVDTLRTEAGDYFTARSIVKTYYLQIRVKNAQYLSSTVALLTGLAGSKRLSDESCRSDDPVTVYFGMRQADVRRDGAETAVIYATFSTFDKLPDRDNSLEISFELATTYGVTYTASLDITDKFSEPDAVEHQWILIDRTIEIPEPGDPSGGGFSPGVDDWNDIGSDIFI